MSRAYGWNAKLLIAEESTYGTLSSGPYTQVPFASSAIDSEQGLISSNVLGLGRDPTTPFQDVINVEGDLAVPVDLRNIGIWLKAVFGVPETTNENGVYTHTFESGKTTLPSYSLELGLAEVPEYIRFLGARANSIAFNFARSGEAQATVSLMAQSETASETSVSDAPEVKNYNSILRPRVSYLEKIDTKNTMVYFVDALGVEYLSFILAQCNSNNLFANVTVCRSELPSITCMNKEFVDVFSSAGCKIIDIKDLDELKHHGTNDFDYQITKEPIHLIEELNIIATVLEKIRTNIASGKCEKAIIISDHGASRLAVINETENKYEMSEKGKHSGRCCPVSDIDEKPDFATEENGYWVLANYDRFKGGRKANVEVHGGAALEEVCVPIIEITPQHEKIDVRLLDSYKNITVSFRKTALIKFFINKKLTNLKVKIEGKYYDAQPTAEEFVYQVSMPDIRKAKNYIFDVYASENMIASGLQFNVKSEVTVEKDLF